MIGRHQCRSWRKFWTNPSQLAVRLLSRKILKQLLSVDPCALGPVRSLSINIHDPAPILSPVSRPLSAFPASVSPVNFSSTPDREEVTSSLRQDRGGRLRKGLNHLLRPHDIPKLDYGLPRDFGERVRSRAVVAFN